MLHPVRAASGLLTSSELGEHPGRHATHYRLQPPAQITRLAPQVLRGARTLDGNSVVALEMGLPQSAR